MESRQLKSYKGMEIEKSYDLTRYGTIKKDSVLYIAYSENGVYDASKTLAELKRKIDSYVGK